MLSNYRRVFAVPHVLSLLTWSLVARFYMPGLMIAVTFLVEGWTGSYTFAGLVAGAFTLGMALVGPLRGRMADRGDSARLVLVCSAVFSAGLLALALMPGSLWWLAVPLALFTGAFGSPANQIVRALWPRLTFGAERNAIYAAEATTQELLFVFSPVLTAGVVAYAGPRWALSLLAVLALAGAVGFALSLRRAGVAAPAPAPEVPATGAAAPRRSLLRYPALCVLLLMSLLMICGIVGVDLVIVAWANELDSPQYVMVLASVWALGSLVGGAVAGGLRGRPRLVRRSLAAALGLAVLVPFTPPVVHLPTPLWITPLLLLSGMAIAPTVAAVMGRLGDVSPPDRRAEAFGWLASGMGVGSAAAGPMIGALIDGFGVAGGAAGAAVVAALAAALSLFVPSAAEDPASAGTGAPEGSEPGTGPTAPAVPES
ncbi:MFS transporter [Nocardiopsis sp. FIRDI 009]|uniref:MFS transporter n=1 Tax=Nocardiopsis sp. FIRDI 009 TaxID=714197 RepID=UPI001E5B15D2|nr:MFS transporter [Nocardiopsis sp. FIRDI 009]